MNPKTGIAEEIRKALERESQSDGHERVQLRKYIRINSIEWLRSLLDERDKDKKQIEYLQSVVKADETTLERITKERDTFESNYSHLYQNYNELLKERNELSVQRDHLREELEQVKKERERLRIALEDVADYQHRWSDSPIREVQKIARSILSQYTKGET